MADSTLYSVNPAGYGKASGAGAPGAPGKDGKSAYLYVAYASSATGAGFSLTPTNSLKFRAEIHTDTPIASPALADFSGATWVKYIGDDGTGGTGTGNGDMLKSIYDTDGNNVVDAAEKLQVAHKIGDASFDGTQDITLAQIGAQPTLPSGAEGQLLKKTASGVEWSDAPVSLPPGGTTGQVLTKTDTGSGWASLPEQKPAEWGKIEGTLDSQADLKNALDAKITSPETGVVGNYLKKTASGVEWAGAPTGGAATWGGITGEISDQTDLKDALDKKITNPGLWSVGDVLTKTKDGEVWKEAAVKPDPTTVHAVPDNPAFEDVLSKVEVDPVSGASTTVVSLNDFPPTTIEQDIVWSQNSAGSPINNRMLRGHAYRRLQPGPSSASSYKKTITKNTYKAWKVAAWKKDMSMSIPSVDVRIGDADNEPVYDVVAGNFLYVHDWERLTNEDAVNTNEGWPIRVLSQKEMVDKCTKELLQDTEYYVGHTPGYMKKWLEREPNLAPGTGGYFYRWTAATGWQWGEARVSSGGGEIRVTIGTALAEEFDHVVWLFVDKSSNLSSAPNITPWLTSTETIYNVLYTGLKRECLVDVTPTIMSIEPLAGGSVSVWPCRAYQLIATANTVINALGGGNEADVPDLFSSPADGTIVSEATVQTIDRAGLRQEAFIDINPGTFEVTEGDNLTIVDELIPNVVNHCRIVWTGQLARLYVYEAELYTFETGDWYIEGTVNEELSVDLSTKVFSLPSTVTPVFTPRPGYVLPTGLSLSPSGMLTGTPTIATGTGGSTGVFTTYVVVSAPGYRDSRVKLEFEIAQQGTITTTPQTINGIALVALDDVDANLGKAVSVSNKREAQYALATDSTLPEGLSLSRAGILSGRPSTSGETTTNITVSARGCPDATLTVTFQIVKGTITTKNSSITGVVDSPISEGVGVLDSTVASTNNGQRCFFAVAEGSTLPGGLTLVNPTSISSVAKITGTPTTAGRTEVTFNVTAEQCTPATVVITFSIADNIPEGTIAASDQTVNGTKGESLTAQLAATASNSMTCTFALAGGASLPSGINMEATGKITGAPAAAGTSAVKVKISARNCPDVEITITFNIADSIPTGTITVTTNPTIRGVVGIAITSYNLASCVTVSNGQTPSFRWNDVYCPQPPWLTLTTSGTLSGTPTSIPSPTDGKVLVSAYKCSNEPNINITWDIIAAGVITVSAQTIKGTVGTALSSFNLYDLTDVSNSQTPTFAVKSGNALPEGIALSSDGVFTGTPTATSSATVVVQITARGCPTKDVNITFDITEAQSVSDGFPVSFTVSSVSYQGQSITAPCGTYTRTGEAFHLSPSSVAYPVYSYTGSDNKIYYICVVANMFGGDGPAWMLTGTKPTASSVTSALAVNSYGGTTLKSGTYEPADTQWTGSDGNAVVSWEMGNAGTAALTAKAFGHPTWRIATQFSAVLQKYTYTGTFTVNGETFPYYTGNGSTPWYLFGGKARANTGSSAPWFYVVYLSSKNPTTISSWAGLEFTWGVDNNTRLIMAGGAVESTSPAPTYSEISSELSTTLLNSNKWWYVDDSDYPQSERADTITWE